MLWFTISAVVTIHLPSALNAAQLTSDRCPWSAAIGLPVRASQRWADLSGVEEWLRPPSFQVSKRRLSGLKTPALMIGAFRGPTGRSCLSPAASQTGACPVSPAVQPRRQSALHAPENSWFHLPCRMTSCFPVLASQMRAVWSDPLLLEKRRLDPEVLIVARVDW